MKRKLGEVFEFIGYRLRVEESKKNDCEGCFLYELCCHCEEMMSETGDCDGVIFKQLEEES